MKELLNEIHTIKTPEEFHTACKGLVKGSHLILFQSELPIEEEEANSSEFDSYLFCKVMGEKNINQETRCFFIIGLIEDKEAILDLIDKLVKRLGGIITGSGPIH